MISSYGNPPLPLLIQKNPYHFPFPLVAALVELPMLQPSCANLLAVELTETGISGQVFYFLLQFYPSALRFTKTIFVMSIYSF